MASTILPNDFDWKFYLTYHKDLSIVGYKTREQAVNHYLRHGHKEKRLYKPTLPNDFDWESYLLNNEDLRKNGINNKEKAIKHYLKHGIYERRTYSEKIKKNKNIVYIISNITGGGSLKYLNDIISFYDDTKFVFIKTKKDLLSIDYKTKDVLFLQHLLMTDIEINDIIDIKIKTNCKLVISIHDFYWLLNEPQKKYSIDIHSNYLENKITINNNIKKLFSLADDTLHPSKFTYDIFSKLFNNKNFKIVTHNDYFVDYSTKNLPKILNKTINIGVFSEYTICKGKNIIQKLTEKYKNFYDLNVNWYIVGENIPKYNESEFFEYIEKYHIHCLVHLNQFGETWCYSLTKSINSGLPIIYNNFGSFKERIPDNVEHYFKVYENEKQDDESLLFNVFEKMLMYVIKNNGKYNRINKSTEIFYNDYYNLLFGSKCNIQPYAIYFPQFYSIEENDKNFYKNYNDIINLKFYFEENPDNPENIERPDISIYGLNKLNEYNLTNKKITDKQVEIAKSYGIDGFAIYYYWFSNNSITGNNALLEKGYENFFKDKYENFKVFFIWANEDWTNNPAFNSNGDISNKYDNVNFNKNVDNLMKYFTHENYHKINNKPVFMLHHPWFITNEKVYDLYHILESKCIENKLDGIHFIVNSIGGKYKNYENYDFHPNYKNNKSISFVDGKRTIDYENYVESLKFDENSISTLFFDFNNTCRMYKPNRLDKTTRIINNSEKNILKYVEKLKSHYVKNNIDNILLLNAWNEWGEKMHLEPSLEKKDYYLRIIKKIKN